MMMMVLMMMMMGTGLSLTGTWKDGVKVVGGSTSLNSCQRDLQTDPLVSGRGIRGW
jgi:hypothetical protein